MFPSQMESFLQLSKSLKAVPVHKIGSLWKSVMIVKFPYCLILRKSMKKFIFSTSTRKSILDNLGFVNRTTIHTVLITL